MARRLTPMIHNITSVMIGDIMMVVRRHAATELYDVFFSSAMGCEAHTFNAEQFDQWLDDLEKAVLDSIRRIATSKVQKEKQAAGRPSAAPAAYIGSLEVDPI